jgi:hypothetical protein
VLLRFIYEILMEAGVKVMPTEGEHWPAPGSVDSILS